MTHKNELENFKFCVLTRSTAKSNRKIEEKMLFQLRMYSEKRREQVANILNVSEEILEFVVVLPESQSLRFNVR